MIAKYKLPIERKSQNCDLILRNSEVISRNFKIKSRSYLLNVLLCGRNKLPQHTVCYDDKIIPHYIVS